MKRLKVGVVGIGFIGAAHVDAIRRVPYAEVVAVASSTTERARRHADDLGIERAYGDYRELLADPDVDVVHNCTPNRWHFPINLATIQAGKACFSEKPLTLNAEEAAELVRVARETGVPTAVNFNHRGFPQVQEARTLVERGEIGRVHAVHGSYLQDWALLESDWGWRMDSSLGGATRVVADIGSHWMDLAQHVTGSRIVSVMADFVTLHQTRMRPERAAVTFERGAGRPAPPLRWTSTPKTSPRCWSASRTGRAARSRSRRSAPGARTGSHWKWTAARVRWPGAPKRASSSGAAPGPSRPERSSATRGWRCGRISRGCRPATPRAGPMRC